MLLAVDPGRRKCGLAILADDGSVLERSIVETAKVEDELVRLKSLHALDRVVVGDGTFLADVRRTLDKVFGAQSVAEIDEYRTTDEARVLYFQENPPRGFWRLVPLGLQFPPRPIDDYAAVVLGRRFLSVEKKKAP